MSYVEDDNGNHIIDDDGNKINSSVSYEVDNTPAYIHREPLHIDDDGHNLSILKTDISSSRTGSMPIMLSQKVN